jgi:O-antigen/teichoic acid export membrane protein
VRRPRPFTPAWAGWWLAAADPAIRGTNVLNSLQRLAVDSITSYLRFGATLLVQFALVPIVIRHVGSEDYGLWTLTSAVLGVLSLTDLGFTTTVVRFVGECRGTGDLDRRNRILSTVVLVYVVLAVASAAGLAIVSTFYVGVLGIPAHERDRALVLLWIVAARWILIGLPFGIYRSILFGDRQITAVNAIQTGGALLYGITAWVSLVAGFGLEGIAWAGLASFAAEHAAYLGAAYRRVEGLRLSWRLVEPALFWDATSVSVSQFAVSVSSLVLVRTDPIIVQVFFSLQAVALYGVALKVAENALILLKQAVNALAPVVAEWNGVADQARIRTVLVSGAKFTFAPAVALTAATWALGREGLLFWTGPQFQDATLLLQILVTAMMLAVPQMVASVVFTMSGDHRLTAWASVISMIVNLAASIILVQLVGVVGVALGTLVAAVLIDTGFVIVLVHRRHGVRYGEYLRRVYAPVLWPGVIAFVAMKGCAWLLPPQGLLAVGAEAAVGFAVYAALVLQFGLDGAERQLLANLVRRVAPEAAGDTEPAAAG